LKTVRKFRGMCDYNREAGVFIGNKKKLELTKTKCPSLCKESRYSTI
jgi:hypothetical protein